MSERGQAILIGVIFAVGVGMIVLVPRFTGIDGRLVGVGGPRRSLVIGRPSITCRSPTARSS
jgi:hypothetical protein